MFEAWGRALARRRRLVLAITVLFVALAGVWGTGVFGKLSAGELHPAGQPEPARSQCGRPGLRPERGGRRGAVPQRRDDRRRPGLPASRHGRPERLAAGRRDQGDHVLVRRVARPGQHRPALDLRGAPAHRGRRRGPPHDLRRDPRRADPSLAANGITAKVGGNVPTEVAINTEVTADIAKAEGFSMPVLLILMMVIFGSLAAASLPWPSAAWPSSARSPCCACSPWSTTVSIYSVNITTILGLGLGIDYGLFMVTGSARSCAAGRHRRTGGRAHRRHRGAHGGGVRRHGRGRADQPDAVPGGFPALDGVRRGRHGRGDRKCGGGGDRAARPARRPRPEVNALRIRPGGAAGRGRESGAWYRLARSVMRRPLSTSR